MVNISVSDENHVIVATNGTLHFAASHLEAFYVCLCHKKDGGLIWVDAYAYNDPIHIVDSIDDRVFSKMY